MENRKFKNEIKNIDIYKIDNETFGESLLACVPNIKKICKRLDEKIYNMALLSYIPYVSAIDQYEDVIDNMVNKSQLITLYKIFAKWYDGLSDKKKKFYRYYFVKRDERTSRKVLKNSQFRARYLSPMIRSFMDQVRIELNFNEKELIKNPFIYKVYVKLSATTELNEQ